MLFKQEINRNKGKLEGIFMETELTILMGWYKEHDPVKVEAFEENRQSFLSHNPDCQLLTVMNVFEDNEQAWLASDLPMFYWYLINGRKHNSKRYLLVEWDCWCDCDLKDYFKLVWDLDLVVPSVKYPERDEWYWFKHYSVLPNNLQKYATGIVPFCGILVSDYAMNKISQEIIKPDYLNLISELRLGTVATMLGIDPVPNPVCNRTITWKESNPFELKYKGLHHPRKRLIS